MSRIMTRARHVRLVSNADLDAYEAGVKLTARYEIASHSGDELELRRVEALIAAHDFQHATQLLAELTAA